MCVGPADSRTIEETADGLLEAFESRCQRLAECARTLEP